jgi:hypothetical protein|tara:strand:- start:109 stop:381 length:273 start_codon:yes stop_codon:yes gene_type:complete
MTWFDLVKISLIDEVLQHLELYRDLRIEYQKGKYGINEQRNTFYVNTQIDLFQLAKYFNKSDDFEIYSPEFPPDFDFSFYPPDWFIVSKK